MQKKESKNKHTPKNPNEIKKSDVIPHKENIFIKYIPLKGKLFSRNKGDEYIYFCIFRANAHPKIIASTDISVTWKDGEYTATKTAIALFGGDAFCFFREGFTEPIDIYGKGTLVASEVKALLYNKTYAQWMQSQEESKIIEEIMENRKYIYAAIAVGALAAWFAFNIDKTLKTIIFALSKIEGLEFLENVI